MLDLFGGLRSVIKRRPIVTDNAVFRLHYMLTCMMLVGFSLMVTARQYFGDPIECTVSADVPFIDVYCWITSTFLMPGHFHKQVGEYVPHPGVGNSRNVEEDKKYYAYYQWVCFVLFFQAMLFYVPRFLWRAWEGNRVQTLVLGMHIGVMGEEEKTNRKRVLVEYLSKHLRYHTSYAIKYFSCELLCLINVFLQMFLMNKFLGGEFMSYGSRVLAYSELEQMNRTDPMIYVFPRMTKCVYHTVGMSGDIQKHDSLCILPHNIVNEKIYIFLWFWFWILAVITTLLMFFRILLFAFPKYRIKLLHARCRMASVESLRAIFRRTNIGDWFLLYMLGKNMDPIIFREVVGELAKKLETNDSNNP